MTQGMDRRLRCMERSQRKESPLPYLKVRHNARNHASSLVHSCVKTPTGTLLRGIHLVFNLGCWGSGDHCRDDMGVFNCSRVVLTRFV